MSVAATAQYGTSFIPYTHGKKENHNLIYHFSYVCYTVANDVCGRDSIHHVRQFIESFVHHI